MYIEYKGDGIVGPARIGRVNYSKSGTNQFIIKENYLKHLEGGVLKQIILRSKVVLSIGFLVVTRMGLMLFIIPMSRLMKMFVRNIGI